MLISHGAAGDLTSLPGQEPAGGADTALHRRISQSGTSCSDPGHQLDGAGLRPADQVLRQSASGPVTVCRRARFEAGIAAYLQQLIDRAPLTELHNIYMHVSMNVCMTVRSAEKYNAIFDDT